MMLEQPHQLMNSLLKYKKVLFLKKKKKNTKSAQFYTF